MSANSVYTDLSDFIDNDSIDLWEAATDPTGGLTAMQPMLELFGIDSSYVLTSVVLTKSAGDTSVTLTGSGTFSSSSAYPVNATLFYNQSGDVFSLSLEVTTNWNFSDFFEPLPETLMQDPTVELGIRWYPSVLANMNIQAATFYGQTGENQTLTLTGSLLEPDNQYLLDKTPMIGPWPLRLSGTVEMPVGERSYPLLNLNAVGNSTAINVAQDAGVDGPSSLVLEEPGLTLIVSTLIPAQVDRVAFSTIELYGGFSLGQIQGRISTLILSTGTVWDFTVKFNKYATLVQGLAELTKIFGVELPVAMNFPILSDFYVGEIDLNLQNKNPEGQMPSFSLLNLGMTIRSDKVWNPPLPFVTITNVGTRWVWGWTEVLDDVGGGYKKIYSLSGSVFGTVNFGDSGTSRELSPSPHDDPDNPGLVLASDIDPIMLDMNMSLPNFIISGSLSDGTYIPIGQVLTYFFGNSGPSTGPQSMNVTKLRFSADPIDQNYFASGSILFGNPSSPDAEQGWVIDLIVLTIILNQLEFFVNVNTGNVSGGISGTLFLDVVDPSNYRLPRIVLSAEYPPQNPNIPQGWTLAGYLYPGTSIDLTKLVYKFIYGNDGTEVPEWIPDLMVDRLSVVFTTGSSSGATPTGPSYVFGGTISMRWEPEIFGTQLKINASTSLDMQKLSDSTTATGSLSGFFSVNSLSLSASLTFGVPEPTYLFKVQFDEIWLQAITSWRGASDNRHQVVTLQLGGVTLGDMLEYLVNLAAPTLGFELDSPWDVLKKIELSRFELTIDPQENIIEFVYNTNVDLVIAKLDSIGVRYTKNSGEGQVDMILTGSFLGEKYDDSDPLSWDVINDPAPAVPGEGITLVNLRYLGLGQHVTFNGETPNTVAESIAKLKNDMTPPDGNGDPMPSTMSYSADSQWLIGLDIELMQTVNLGFIFNDPKLYGLSIALGGERAGSLAGLRFEILYKKITNDIGMFRIEFQVPDMFRTIQLGAVSLTLGIIVIAIYTNGNFKIDLGFPYDRNFDRAFSIQATIFIGRGGFYFGVLNGDTSTQVPRITNGNFSPVIELGIGMAVGVGREIREGILSGGAYVELEVIFMGVLAWFNPTSSGTAPAKYFKCQGIAAIHGKVYGSVDFKVVKVSVTLEAYAQVSIIYEVYKPMLIDLSVDVTAKASVKILFVRVHFSFNVHLDLSFTVGSSQPTPWIIDESYSNDSSQRVMKAGEMGGSNRRAIRTSGLKRNKHNRIQVLRNTHLGKQELFKSPNLIQDSNETDSVYLLNWDPSGKVFPDSPRKAHMTLLPLFSLKDVPINWDDTIPTNDDPNYRSAFVLFADTGMSADATNAAECKVRTAAHSGMALDDNDTSTLAADIVTEGLILYTINALPREVSEGNVITAGQIDLLLEQLDLPETFDTGFNITNLATFFQTNINLWISGDTNPKPDEKSAMVIPIPPFMGWTSPQAGDVDFSTKNEIGPLYEFLISQYLNTYSPVSGDDSEAPVDDLSKYESFAGFMFRDFCLMLVQSAVKEMQSLMNETAVEVETVDGTVQSLSEIANTFPTALVNYSLNSGDTVDSVADNLGATAAELEFLNPSLAEELRTEPVGTNLEVLLGISPEVIALDNADEVFGIDQCELGTIVHQAAEEDCLSDIAELFQVLKQNGDPDVVALLEFNDSSFPALTSENNILSYGMSFNIESQIFNNAPVDFVQLRTAGAFFVRYIDLNIFVGSAVPEQANWYVQAITVTNQALLETMFPDQHIPSEIELPPGQVLSVPNAYNNAYTETGNTNSYTTVNGDTLNRIGYTLTLQQDYGSDTPQNPEEWQQQWLDFQAGVTSNGANSWSITAQSDIPVDVGQTIESLVRRLVIDATWTGSNPTKPAEGAWSYNWDSVAVWIGDAKILASLATVTVPNAKTAVNNALSFSVLSKTYGLGVVEAAEKLKDVAGLYPSGKSLTIKLLPAQDITVLVDAVLQGESFAAIVNQSSRLLMSGLQLPKPECENGGDLPCTTGEHVVPNFSERLPVYDLTGQQFDLSVDSEQPTETALSLALYSEEAWIQLFDSITVVEGDTLVGLEAEYPDLLEYNPGLDESTFKVGMVLLTEPVTTTLDYDYTNQDVLAASPETGLSVDPLSIPVGGISDATSPRALPLSGTVPVTYGLEHSIELQTPITLPIPQIPEEETISGNPSLWMFPPGLLQKVAQGVSTKYETLYSPLGSPAGKDAQEIESSTYGMLMPFNVKRLGDSASQFSLLGVDTDKRGLLISLIQWLNDEGVGDTKAYLLLSPAPNSGNTSGLTLLNPDPDDTFLIKSNLSTESVPPTITTREVYEGEPQETYFAALSSLTEFLTLLWEGSVVGGTGYYFGAGQNISASAFDQEGNVTLQLMVIAGTQQQVETDGRALLPFNNCVLLGVGFDSSSYALFVESSDGSETSVQALVPPGNVGFELMTNNPSTQVGIQPEKEIDLQNLFSLLTFEVLQTVGSPFEATASGMPVMPEPSDGTALPPSEKQRLLRKARKSKARGVEEDVLEELYWYYQQVLPVSRFVADSVAEAAPNVVGLPIPEADPYQGYGTESSIPTANFAFGFGDVLGNRTATVINAGSNNSQPGITPIEVGYTDNIVGITEWPSIARYFNVTGTDGADLTLVISSRPAETLPTPSQTGEMNTDLIDQQIKKYGQIYYQFIQPGVEGWIVSSLKFIENAQYGNEGLQIADISPLWKFAAGAYVNAQSVQAFSSAKPVDVNTLKDIIDQYGIRYTELAQANSDTLLSSLFGSTLPAVPAYYPFVEYQSMEALLSLPPEGWPEPSGAQELLGYPENTSLVLRLETALNIPTVVIVTESVLPTSNMQTIADANNTNVGLLAVGNSSSPVLQDGFVFTVEIDDGVVIPVEVDSATNSFDLVVSAYEAQGVHITVSGLAELHANEDNIFAIGQDLNIKHYVTKAGDTLDINSSNVSTTDLVANNIQTPNIFDPGALVYFGQFSNVTFGDVPPTLQQFADRFACPVELLLSNNANFALPASSEFLLPGTLSWPGNVLDLRIPYTVRSSDTLTGISAQFSSVDNGTDASLQLAEMNERMPDTMIADLDISVEVNGANYTVNTGSNPSFYSVLTSLQQQVASATLQDLIAAIEDDSGVLAPGALFLCMPAKFNEAQSADSIQGLFGVSPSSFALTNTAMQNLVNPGQTLYSPDGLKTVDTNENDTLNSIITQFADQGVSVDASQIVMSNPSVLIFKENALALLPPAQIDFTVAIGNSGPYMSVISPLQVSLRITRPEDLISPDFRTASGTGPVEMNESDFPPPMSSGVEEESGLNLNAFVDEMKLALPNVRLGTGQVDGVTQDLWCIDFGSNGINEVGLVGQTTINGEAQPWFFALTPLYKHLVTRQLVEIAPLETDGSLGDVELISFQSVDVELWTQRFLEDMDRILSGSFALALYTNKVGNTRDSLQTVLDAKSKLIPEISAGLNSVLDISNASKSAALSDAQDAVEQQLGVSLSKTYESTVLIQYGSEVDSTGDASTASLYGDGGIIADDVPSMTMIAAKTKLAKDSLKPYVNFLMTLDNPSLNKDVKGEFNYTLSHLEFNITDVDIADDYKASDWLSFVPLLSQVEKPEALKGTNPGDVDVPIPLRIFPDLPVIVNHSAKQAYKDGEATLDEESLWNYEFTYSHQHAEQDYVVITTEFNLTMPTLLARAEEEPRDLFTELAQYNSVATSLWNYLNELTKLNSDVDPTYIQNAVETFATLATNISDYWSSRLSPEETSRSTETNLDADYTYEYDVRVNRTGGVISSLKLIKLSPDVGPNNTWPGAYVQKLDGSFVPMVEASRTTDQIVYDIPEGVEILATDWPVFKLVWGDLNVSTLQNARSKIKVERNQDLLDGVDVSTNPDFVFSTETIITPSIVTPLNVFGNRIDISPLGSTLAEALDQCFTDLFGTNAYGQKVTMELSYGFELVSPSSDSDQGLVTYLPIGLYPNQVITANTGTELSGIIDRWELANKPSQNGGEWVFSIKLYSQLTDNTQTLLSIEHLVYKIVE